MNMIYKLLILTAMIAVTACQPSYAFEGLHDGASLKVFNRINCASKLDCVAKGRGIFDMKVDPLETQIEATATTITEAQCGSTFINAGAVQIELPEASAVLGCRLTFITGDASNFDINPDDADQILVETDAVGDSIRNATLGNSIQIEAISASEWAPVATVGTWLDNN